MTDRLPEPMTDGGRGVYAERASASPGQAPSASRRGSGDASYVAATRTKTRSRSSFGPVPRSLPDVERWMVGAITSTDEPLSVEDVLSDGPRQTARERLDVYRSGYRARLVECLEDDYPVLAETLGLDRFEALARAYVDRHPSTSPNLNAFGRHMATFCRDAERANADGHGPFRSELAALEWAVVEAIHAEAAQSFDAGRLQEQSTDKLSAVVFLPSDAVKLLKFQFPVNAYYQAWRTGSRPSVPARGTSATAVYRRGLTVWRMDLTPAMTRVLEALLDSRPLGEALSRIGIDEADERAVKEAERSVMSWFREWVSSGFFSGFR